MRLPFVSPRRVARRLIRSADAARDTGHFLAAALLYEEAFRLVPLRSDLLVQCGHMHKEAGDFTRAEAFYLQALKALPNDADLALQLGHFYRLAGRNVEADAWYAKAAARTHPYSGVERTGDDLTGAANEVERLPVAALLPAPLSSVTGPVTDIILMRRLGARLQTTGEGNRHTLSGVEALRGVCFAFADTLKLSIFLDGVLLHQDRLLPVAQPNAAGAPAKFAFNAWIDVSLSPLGSSIVVVELAGAPGGLIRHEQHVTITLPIGEAEAPSSDAVVSLTPGDSRSPQAQIRGRPSMIRPAERRLLAMPIRTILVQRADQLGDLIVSVPAIKRLRALFPQATLTALLSPANAELGRRLGLFDQIVIVDFVEDPATRRRSLTAAAQVALAAELAPFAFDVAVDLSLDPMFRPLLLLSGARVMHGFGGQSFPWLTSHVQGGVRDVGNAEEASAHAAKLLALVEWLGAIMGPSQAVMPLAQRPEGRPYAVLHCGARLPFSRWPWFEALAQALLTRTSLDLVILGADAALAAALRGILEATGRIRIVEDELPFDQFDALLGGCAVFVGNDSGPKHLAALRGAKVVSLHMARLNWAEWGQDSGIVISRRVPCAGCAIHLAPEECTKDFTCITDIRVDEVMTAIEMCLADSMVFPTKTDPLPPSPTAPTPH